MKIEPQPYECFEQAEPGSVFRSIDGHYYLRCRPVPGSQLGEWVAIDCQNGCVRGFAPSEPVTLLPNARLSFT